MILTFNVYYSEDCTILNPNDYGTCGTMVGYVWTGSECSAVYGCDMNGNDEFFYIDFETCDFI